MTESGNDAITFIFGGARSGKSQLAETLAVEKAAQTGGSLIYVATAEAHDAEMATRIQTHQSRRGAAWQTIDAPYDLADAIAANATPARVILVDCLTLWLTNHMLRRETDALQSAIGDLLSAVSNARGSLYLVSNEVGLGIVPENALARRFRDHAGQLHQSVAALADTVLFTAAGLPLALKGHLPIAGTTRG